MPPVQIHVALTGIRCLYHHDVHGWWTTKGLWDVHMLRVRSTRPSQSLLGGTKRRSRLGTMPWPRITSMTLESCRFLSEQWKNFFNFVKRGFTNPTVSWHSWFHSSMGSWVKKWILKFPTMLFFIDAASQSVRCQVSISCRGKPKHPGASVPVVKWQFCHPKALPLHGPSAFLPVRSTATAR